MIGLPGSPAVRYDPRGTRPGFSDGAPRARPA